jgi:hypothetical protein
MHRARTDLTRAFGSLLVAQNAHVTRWRRHRVGWKPDNNSVLEMWVHLTPAGCLAQEEHQLLRKT